MPDLIGYLTNRNGSLYFASSSTLWDSPEMVTNAWRLGEAVPSLEGEEAVASNIDTRVTNRDLYYKVRLWPALGDRVSDIHEIEKVPPPNTKFPTRWYEGRWQKQLKSGRWKDAEPGKRRKNPIGSYAGSPLSAEFMRDQAPPPEPPESTFEISTSGPYAPTSRRRGKKNPSDPEAKLDAAAVSARVGLNADFAAQAWYFGGDIYIVDAEGDIGEFELVRSWFDEDEGMREFEELDYGTNIDRLIAEARQLTGAARSNPVVTSVLEDDPRFDPLHTTVTIEWGAVRNQNEARGGWLPATWEDGRFYGDTYSGHTLDLDEALRQAKEKADDMLDRLSGDYNVVFRPRGAAPHAFDIEYNPGGNKGQFLTADSFIATPALIENPFAGYEDFADCEAANSDKRDPGAYCGAIKRRTENPMTDPHAVRELILFIENDGDLYRQQIVPIQKNLMKKWRKGVYDETKAAKLFEYLADAGAKKYHREFGGSGTWHSQWPKSVRREVARQMAASFTAEAELGNYDYLVGNPTRKTGRREWTNYGVGGRVLGTFKRKKDAKAQLQAIAIHSNPSTPTPSDAEILQMFEYVDHEFTSLAEGKLYDDQVIEGFKHIREPGFANERLLIKERDGTTSVYSMSLGGDFTAQDIRNQIGAEKLDRLYLQSFPLYKRQQMIGEARGYGWGHAKPKENPSLVMLNYGELPSRAEFARVVGPNLPFYAEFKGDNARVADEIDYHGERLDDPDELYDVVKNLVDLWEEGDEAAGDLASGIMQVSGFEWV